MPATPTSCAWVARSVAPPCTSAIATAFSTAYCGPSHRFSASLWIPHAADEIALGTQWQLRGTGLSPCAVGSGDRRPGDGTERLVCGKSLPDRYRSGLGS